MNRPGDKQGCECSAERLQALFCELLDHCQDSARAAEIRQEIAQCEACLEKLEHEEVVRAIVRQCCGQTPAPESLRERITIQIRSTRTEFRW